MLPVLVALLCLPPLLLLAGAVLLHLHHRALRKTISFPQPGAVPVLGHLFHILKPRDELFWTMRSFRKALGSRYALIVFDRPVVNLSDPEALEVLLSSSKHTEKSMVYDFLQPWLGRGLLTSSGLLWRSRRKMLTPAFHFRILGQFSEHLERQAEALVEQLEQWGAEPMDVVPIISRITLRSIGVTAMGQVDFNMEGGEESYFDAIHRVGNAIVHRLSRPWLWWRLAFAMTSVGRSFGRDLRVLHDFTAKVIAERKQQLKDGNVQATQGPPTESHVDAGRGPRRPFLDMLLSSQGAGDPLSDQDIREEVDTFMFEGHDTTAMALCWALELLGRHPAEQQLLAEEILAAGSSWESVSKLPYLDRVMKECLRLRPSVPFISRHATEDITLQDGQVIPRMAAVHVHIYDLHRHPDHFPDPERFDPDRFLPELEQQRHPFAYLPFSAGPRNCIGKRFAQMEVKLVLAAVVRRFVVRSAMPEQLDVVADLVLRPKNGIHLKLTKRTPL